jgi:hypothetical protein
MSEKKIFREWVNYVVTENCIVGAAVNMPLVCQAKNMDDLKRKMKALSMSYLKHMKETIELDDPFDFKEMTQEEWRNQHRKQLPESKK